MPNRDRAELIRYAIGLWYTLFFLILLGGVFTARQQSSTTMPRLVPPADGTSITTITSSER